MNTYIIKDGTRAVIMAKNEQLAKVLYVQAFDKSELSKEEKEAWLSEIKVELISPVVQKAYLL